MGRSRGGLTSKIHAVVDRNGLPVRLALSPGEAHALINTIAASGGELPEAAPRQDRATLEQPDPGELVFSRRAALASSAV